MPRFELFDRRRYRTLDVASGYREWVPTYEQTVEDEMDLALLDALSIVRWETVGRAVDLGCGTGRTGAWLRANGVRAVDGVDLTPEMLQAARGRGAHARLIEADVCSTGLEAEAYDLTIASLVDEHLPELGPLYREAWRLTNSAGAFVLVGYHPHFIMVSGMPTHFENAAGEPTAIETHVHLLSEHASCGLDTGWSLGEMKERLIDETWVALKPKWERFLGHPISFALVWRKL